MKKILSIALAVILILLIGLVAYNLFLAPQSKVDANSGSMTPAEVAETAVRLVFNVNLAEDTEENYYAAVCRIASELGCGAFRNTFGPAIWKSVEAIGANSEVAEATAIEKVDDGQDPNGNPQEIWRVNTRVINMSGEKTEDVFIIVVKENGEWKFMAFLFGPAADKYKEK